MSDIDESLYSRQLYVMGHEAQRRMAASTVIIVGLGGLGVEVAKNIILAGVKSVILYENDNSKTQISDLSAQFYLTEEDVRLGNRRCDSSLPKLKELNPYVSVTTMKGDLKDIISKSSPTAVVLTEASIDDQLAISAYCRNAGVCLVISDVWGIFASVFCDFGPSFVVNDSNGEPAASSMIAGVTLSSLDSAPKNSTVLMVTVLEENRHNLESGDRVTLSGIVATGYLDLLNGNEFDVVVKNNDPYNFFIYLQLPAGVTTTGATYERGGYVNQIKKPVTVSFQPLVQSLFDPKEIVCDSMKLHLVSAMHVAFFALKQYQKKYGYLPEAGNVHHAEEFFQLTLQANSTEFAGLGISAESLRQEEKIIKRLALCSRGVLSPICALIGGVVGQEVLTACSGKFMPIKQWFYYDASETLSDEPLPQEEVSPVGSRYDGQIMVYGKQLQSQLLQLNMFLVGAGAIGCEMIKNWAMMGISSPARGGKGITYVTDMDRIEKSNLSRQFLFRNTDINHPKSTTAARAVTQMNPAFNATSFENKVAPETEYIFNDDFFESLDMVCTALDNVEARLYIDQKCLFYHKPMLESGTLGPKGHTQVVVPFKTENYGASRDPPEKSIPVCTLKHFPNQIDHTLQWAREWFEEVFQQTPEDVKQYVSMPSREAYDNILAAQQNMKMDTLLRVSAAIGADTRLTTYAHCVIWARKAFEELFANRIKQLLFSFPLDRLTANGTPFWSGAKSPPMPLQFNIADPLHAEFIISTANLLAAVYSIPLPEVDINALMSTVSMAISSTKIPAFSPQQG
eukprot:gene25282-32993_t